MIKSIVLLRQELAHTRFILVIQNSEHFQQRHHLRVLAVFPGPGLWVPEVLNPGLVL